MKRPKSSPNQVKKGKNARLEPIYPQAAGIDIGSEEHSISYLTGSVEPLKLDIL